MKKEKYPVKKTINLAQKESKSRDWLTLVVGLALIACLAAAVSKFGVIDQYERLSKAEGEYYSLSSEVQAINDSIADYDDVLSEYRTYSTGWLKDSDEGAYVAVDRREVLDLLEKEVMPRGEIESIGISGDSVAIQMRGMSLSEISDMCNTLETYDIVGYCGLTYGETETDDDAYGYLEDGSEIASGDVEDMSFSLTIYLEDPDAEEEVSESEAEALLEAAGISVDEAGEEAEE